MNGDAFEPVKALLSQSGTRVGNVTKPPSETAVAARVPAQALGGRRFLTRAILGAVARASQGLLLASAVAFLDPLASSNLALALTASAMMNLVSNAGIPTLFVRHARRGCPREQLEGLARAYTILTLLASCLLLIGLWVWLEQPALAIAATALLLFQSLYAGLEYWSLGWGNAAYDQFLRRAGVALALTSLTAPAALVLTHSAALGVGILALAYSAGLAISVRHPVRLARTLINARAGTRGWIRAASAVGTGTVLAAIFYGADAFILRACAGPDLVSSYRLSIVCISFLVGLVPLNLFTLADVSAGGRVSVYVLAVAAIACGAASALGGVLAPLASSRFGVVGEGLLLLAPLAAVRLLNQVLATVVHGLGRHAFVALAYGFGIFGWVVALVALLEPHKPVGLLRMALTESVLEVSVAVALFIAIRVGSRRSM